MGLRFRGSVQKTLTETMGMGTERLERVETGVDETRQALVQFSEAVAEYATHLQSHTSAVRGMSEGSESLVEAVKRQNKILTRLDETLGGDGSPQSSWPFINKSRRW